MFMGRLLSGYVTKDYNIPAVNEVSIPYGKG